MGKTTNIPFSESTIPRTLCMHASTAKVSFYRQSESWTRLKVQRREKAFIGSTDFLVSAIGL